MTRTRWLVVYVALVFVIGSLPSVFQKGSTWIPCDCGTLVWPGK
jgi:hypothetical protein